MSRLCLHGRPFGTRGVKQQWGMLAKSIFGVEQTGLNAGAASVTVLRYVTRVLWAAVNLHRALL